MKNQRLNSQSVDRMVATEQFEEQQLRKMRGLSGENNTSTKYWERFKCCRKEFIQPSTINQILKKTISERKLQVNNQIFISWKLN